MTNLSTNTELLANKSVTAIEVPKLAIGRKVADDELWLRLDEKLAERDEELRRARSRKQAKGLFARLFQGMGISRV
ncbi:hypothetical protein ACSBLW_15675 [Thioclava sp. FR2]|uniref:hypothetical protein n=1 Tax=Thioclava sp. FR2 TaxID=3445780 RepID=UPI003EBD2C42